MSSTTINLAGPVNQAERITLLDSLRGIAILGILLMNIPGFGMPMPSAFDPSVLNESGTINYKTWFIIEWIPHGTQRALFSMLFGAGILLFLGNKEKNLDGVWPADYFFRRQLWLIVFSLIDVFILLWYGDILLDYAILGMVMFAFRRLPAKKLLIGAGLCFLFMLARENRDLYQDKVMIRKGERVEKLDTTTTKLTGQQKADLDEMVSFREKNLHENKVKRTQKSKAKMTGSYAVLYETRTDIYINNLVKYLFFEPWDVLVFMFIGMAFLKMGILTGQAKTSLYAGLCIVGLGLGLTLSWLHIQPMEDNKFNWFDYTKNIPFEFYELTRLLRALGFFGLVMLLYKSGWFKWLFALMRPVGQMAFTNYLMQSLLCGIIFYGIGFGMYGSLERHEIYYVVAAIWLFQIIISHIWLRFFRFGPLEWLWRSLTYWKKQPFRKSVSH
jgi:uncharacterized protein